MLKEKYGLIMVGGSGNVNGLMSKIGRLPDGDYDVLVFDGTRNRSLPQLKYLFGVVLKGISEKMDGNPPVEALYRYFEEMFAPSHACFVDGQEYSYRNMKGEKTQTISDFIDKIISHAHDKWGITIETKDEVKMPEAKELWAGAYEEQWNKYLKN